jgi:hypothetical protein
MARECWWLKPSKAAMISAPGVEWLVDVGPIGGSSDRRVELDCHMVELELAVHGWRRRA